MVAEKIEKKSEMVGYESQWHQEQKSRSALQRDPESDPELTHVIGSALLEKSAQGSSDGYLSFCPSARPRWDLAFRSRRDSSKDTANQELIRVAAQVIKIY